MVKWNWLQRTMVALSLASCGTTPTISEDATSDASDTAAADVATDTAVAPTETTLAVQREACAFGPGALAATTFGSDAPDLSKAPIDTIVVLMMENRSYDHLLGHLKAFGQPDAEGAPDDASNVDGKGKSVAWFHFDDYCFDDTTHQWNQVHAQFNGGKMDGFCTANGGSSLDPDGHRAMGYYTDADIPFFYQLASTYAIGDRFFCDALGATDMNRLFLYAGSAFGRTYNAIFGDPHRSIMDLLDEAKVEWKVYNESVPGLGILVDGYTSHLDRFVPLADFAKDAAAGKLPQVVFVDPDLLEQAQGGCDDFHPPGNVQLGEKFVFDVVDAVQKSPQWAHTALFVTFDEHGGQFDHVPPPKACVPDDSAFDGKKGDLEVPFDNYGVRVPFIVVSPYARKHFVSHKRLSNASILRFIEARFGMPALSKRDANSHVPAEFFDFAKPEFATPPAFAATTLNQAKADACVKAFPHK